MLVEMQVTGLTIDPVNNTPIVILREREGSRVLPIWVGAIEASAIAFELEQVKLTRPMTHDLLRAAVEALGGQVERVAIVNLTESTFFATVYVVRDGATIELDARPSDAVALALRAKAPIFCAAKILEEAHLRQGQAASPPPAEAAANPVKEPEVDVDRGQDGPRPLLVDGDAARSWRDLLESLDAKDFGKYKM